MKADGQGLTEGATAARGQSSSSSAALRSPQWGGRRSVLALDRRVQGPPYGLLSGPNRSHCSLSRSRSPFG